MFNNSVDNMTIFKGSQKWLPLIHILRNLRTNLVAEYAYSVKNLYGILRILFRYF